jgi:hypothetical protein
MSPIVGQTQFLEFHQERDPNRIRIWMNEQLISKKSKPPGRPGSFFQGHDGGDEAMIASHLFRPSGHGNFIGL